MTNKELGNRIMETRKEREITRDILADTTELSSKFIYEIEYGKKGISANTLLKISKALNCSCDYLLTGTKYTHEMNAEMYAIINKFNPQQTKKLVKILKLVYELIHKS